MSGVSSFHSLSMMEKLKHLRRRASKLLLPVVSLPLGISRVEVTANLQPAFPHLLRSNIPPTERETSIVRDAITAAEAEESRLKGMESSHTGSHCLTVARLNCEFSRIRQFNVQHKTTLSSIRRLPSEVLENIFIHSLPTGLNDSYPNTWSSTSISQLPWALSQVCQLWRITMLSFSVVWRDLPAVNLKKDYTKEKHYLDFLTEILKHTHSPPYTGTNGR